MADDTSYSTFLTRANQDPSSGHAAEGDSTSQARGQFDPSMTNPSEGVPTVLQNISTTYTSDTDSAFEPVFFSYASHELPGVDAFRNVLGVKGGDSEIEELSVEKWDPRGEYKGVVGKVKEAGEAEGGDGKVKVFRVGGEGVRVQYFVVTVGERKLLGVVAKAVES